MKNNAMKMLMPAFIVSIMLAAGFAVAVSGGDSEGTASPDTPTEEETMYAIEWKLRNVTIAEGKVNETDCDGFSFKPVCNEGYKDMTVTIKINGVVATEGGYLCGFGPYYYGYYDGTYYVHWEDGPVTVIATARSATTVISPPATPVEKFYNVYTVSDPDYIKMVGIPADAKVRENAPLNVSISPASVPVKMNVTVTMGGKVMSDAFTYAAGSESLGTVLIGAVVGDVEISVAYEIVTSEGPTETADSNWWILVAVIIAGMALMLVYFRSRKSWQNV